MEKEDSMTEINVEQDLNAVNEQLAKMVEELNKINSAREAIIQQIQNMQGVGMYLRGKSPAEEVATVPTEAELDIDFSTEPETAVIED